MAPVLNPVDYYIPVVNRAVTIQASAITCMIMSWAAVSLRLWSRWKLVHALGWDDLFVSIAAGWALFGAITLSNEVPNGLGLHWTTIVTKNPDGSPNYDTYENYFMWFYLTNVSYTGATTSIKLSLLLQYLRMFPRNIHPRMFRILVALIAIVTAWGITFLSLMIFACDPVDKSWHLMKEGKCIMFGDFRPQNAYAAYASHTSSNMFLDTVILITPIPVLYKTKVGKRAKLGLAGLFTAGTLVVITASLRLCFVVKNKAGTYPTVDPPWYAPPIVLMSVLEVNLAICTASMPIFWPYLATRISGIKVMQEVIVRSEPRKAPYHFSNASSGSHGPSPTPYHYRLNNDPDDRDDASLAKNGSAVAVISTHRRRSDSDPSERRLTRDWWDEAVAEGGLDDDGGGGGVKRERSGTGTSSRTKDSSGGASAARPSSQYRREHHYTSSLPYDGDRHRLYYGDPTVAELVVGDLFGGEPAGLSRVDSTTRGGTGGGRGGGGDGGVGGGETEGFMGAFEERTTGHQAAAWFEPEPVALQDLRGRGKR